MLDYSVKFINYPLQYQNIKKEIDSATQDCLSRGDLILRKDVEEFEHNLASFLGVKYAIGVNSGTDALTIALKTFNIGPGHEVITSGHTFWATAEAILNVGAKPRFVGINYNLTMNTREIKNAINSHTKAIIPVHLAGEMCDMEKIIDISNQNNLIVIEDAAQALGAKQEGISAGTWGDVGCFSFYPAKILGAYGDAGALVTDNINVAEITRELRNHGNRGKREGGINSRLDNLQAAILNVKFKYLKDAITRRKEIAILYDSGLLGCDKLLLPRPREIYQDYIVNASAYQLSLFQFLKDNGIETILDHYDFPDNFRRPESVETLRALRLPIDPVLTNEQVNYVIIKIKEFYEK